MSEKKHGATYVGRRALSLKNFHEGDIEGGNLSEQKRGNLSERYSQKDSDSKKGDKKRNRPEMRPIK